jgi:hypothetical protein
MRTHGASDCRRRDNADTFTPRAVQHAPGQANCWECETGTIPYVQKPVPAETWAMSVSSLQQMLCEVPLHLSAIFSSSSHYVKIPSFTLISWRTCSTRCCNTSESLIGAEYIEVLSVPITQIQGIKVRRSCRPVDWASAFYPLFTERLVQVLSDNAKKNLMAPNLHESRVLSLIKGHICQHSW